MTTNYHIQRVGTKVYIDQPGYPSKLYSADEIRKMLQGATHHRAAVLRAAWALLADRPLLPSERIRIAKRPVSLFGILLAGCVVFGVVSFIAGNYWVSILDLIAAGAMVLGWKWRKP